MPAAGQSSGDGGRGGGAVCQRVTGSSLRDLVLALVLWVMRREVPVCLLGNGVKLRVSPSPRRSPPDQRLLYRSSTTRWPCGLGQVAFPPGASLNVRGPTHRGASKGPGDVQGERPQVTRAVAVPTLTLYRWGMRSEKRNKRVRGKVALPPILRSEHPHLPAHCPLGAGRARGGP